MENGNLDSNFFEEYKLENKFQKILETFKKNQNEVEENQDANSERNSVVNVVLLEGRDLPKGVDQEKIMKFYVRFSLGDEKYASKSSLDAKWLEQFEFYLIDENDVLQIELWNRNTLFGTTNIQLSRVPREMTHVFWQDFDDCEGEILLALTISGVTPIIKEPNSSEPEQNIDKHELRRHYGIINTFKKFKDVGHLTVKVYKATGLRSSDSYCVLELGNNRVQTHTEYKTLDPVWNRIFTFHVKDITSILEITVYDETRNHSYEFLGKVAIPLLRIKSGLKKWYTLKDENLLETAKGNSPKILLKMTLIWNPIRAIFQTIAPKERKFLEKDIKFQRKLFMHNVSRFKGMIQELIKVKDYINYCLSWKSPSLSICALLIWIFICVFLDIWAIPLILLLLIIKNAIIRSFKRKSVLHSTSYLSLKDVDAVSSEVEQVKKKGIRERLRAVQEASDLAQNIIGDVSSMVESAKNIFNFSIPEITWLAAVWLALVFLVLYFIPFRWILLFIGVLKFLKRLLIKDYIPNNELIDFLSRVPDDSDLIKFQEIPISD